MKTSETFWIKIYLSGSIEQAKQIIRKIASGGGLCVTIEATTYIYKGGEEEGYVVGLQNYPRFPVDKEILMRQAQTIALALRDGTYQDSVMIVNPEKTEWYSFREDK